MRTGIFRFAEHTVEIRSIHSYVQKLCKDYAVDAVPEFVIEAKQSDIDSEREKSKEEDLLAGIEIRSFSDGYLESLAVYRRLVEKLLDANILLFHGSLLAMDDQGYLFTAKSGTGKSTHARLWRERFGERVVMVNDDKPLLKIEKGLVTAYGTPWDGKHGLSANRSVPLKGLCILERSQVNHIEPVTGTEAYHMLVQQSYKPVSEEGMLKTMMLLGQLTESVKLYRLGCNMEPEAAEVAWEGICKSNTEDL